MVEFATTEEVQLEVRRLEDILGSFIVNTELEWKRLSRSLASLSKEMKEFKDEMKEFKDEMKGFKDEMKEFKEDSLRERREMNKKWGEVTNKLGTFAEDFAFPNVPRIAREQFNAPDVEQSMVRIDRRDPQNNEDLTEFDCVLVANDIVFWMEAKFTVRMQFIEQLPDYVEKFRRCFPEFKGKRLIPIFGSMSIPDNVVKKLSKLGFYALATGDDNMDIINFKEVKKVLTV